MAIDEFRGEYRFLSNFWICSRGIKFEGDLYRSVEHAYQAAKTRVPEERQKIRACSTSGAAKKAGYRVTLRDDWEDVKLRIMHKLVFAKFYGDERLEKRLLETGKHNLVEGNWWGDTYWGVCQGKGENHLGKILMEARKRLKKLAKKAPEKIDL